MDAAVIDRKAQTIDILARILFGVKPYAFLKDRIKWDGFSNPQAKPTSDTDILVFFKSSCP